MPSRMARSTSSRVTAARAVVAPGIARTRAAAITMPVRARGILRRSMTEASRRADPSGECGVDDDVGGDLEGRLVGVALAVHAGVPLQGAADVVLGVDHRPVAVDLDALELGIVPAAAGGLGVLGVPQVEADLGGEQLVVAGDGDQGVAGQELGGEAAEGGVEGGGAAGGVGEEGAAAGLDVPPQRIQVLTGEREIRP